MPTSADEPTVTIRRVPAEATGVSQLPRWEVTYGGQATGWLVIGWLDEHPPRDTKHPIYIAYAIHPVNGKVYRLDGNISFDERVNTIADFHQNPMTSPQHLIQSPTSDGRLRRTPA